MGYSKSQAKIYSCLDTQGEVKIQHFPLKCIGLEV